MAPSRGHRSLLQPLLSLVDPQKQSSFSKLPPCVYSSVVPLTLAWLTRSSTLDLLIFRPLQNNAWFFGARYDSKLLRRVRTTDIWIGNEAVRHFVGV